MKKFYTICAMLSIVSMVHAQVEEENGGTVIKAITATPLEATTAGVRNYGTRQTKPVAPMYASDIDSLYDVGEKAYTAFVEQKNNSDVDRTQLYSDLLNGYKAYVQTLDSLTGDRREGLKEKFRKMRTEFEEAGIYHSGQGNNKKASEYLACYLNIPKLSLFEGERFPINDNYSAYVYNVAVEQHNERNYEEAVVLFKEYIELGSKGHQQTVYNALAHDLYVLERFDEEVQVLEEAVMNYPNDLDLLKQYIDLCNQRNDDNRAAELLDRALVLAPNDLSLRLFKAAVDDRKGNYAAAIPVYEDLCWRQPNDMQIKKTLAFCYYNHAADLVAKSNTLTDNTEVMSLRTASTEYNNKAITLLEQLNSDPQASQDERISRALAEAYTAAGRADEASIIRQQMSQHTTPLTLSKGSANGNTTFNSIPNFNDWYKPRLDEMLAKWELRGEFEPAEKYIKRVNPDTRRELIAKSRAQLESEYIQQYSSQYNLRDLTIKPYDPDHETFRIQTHQGDIYIHVPIDNDEAKDFKDSWYGVKITMPQFKVDRDGKLLLATALFTTPQGKSYMYDVNQPLTYGQIRIDRPQWNDEEVFVAAVENTPSKQQEKQVTVDEPLNVGESTVDVNIPENKPNTNTNTFALIISNEHYKNVESVPFASADGRSFQRYCTRVLGIPEENIVQVTDATGGEMYGAVDRMKELQAAYEGMKLLVYYSGHGLPDPSNGESYLLPVDATPRSIQTGYKLSTFYQQLTANNTGTVTFFLDACFSGTKRNGEIMDVAARGVAIKAREETPIGKVVVFSACSGSETAYPYENQKHGLFTYFLLKKLQEDKGKTTYKKLAEYISMNVKQQSIRLNGKLQTPTIQSQLQAGDWGDWRLDKE